MSKSVVAINTRNIHGISLMLIVA